YELRVRSAVSCDRRTPEPLTGLCSVNRCRAQCKCKQTAECAIVSYSLADLEFNLAERRLALQMATLRVREQRDDLSVQADPTEGAVSKEQRRQLWWRYY